MRKQIRALSAALGAFRHPQRWKVVSLLSTFLILLLGFQNCSPNFKAVSVNIDQASLQSGGANSNPQPSEPPDEPGLPSEPSTPNEPSTPSEPPNEPSIPDEPTTPSEPSTPVEPEPEPPLPQPGQQVLKPAPTTAPTTSWIGNSFSGKTISVPHNMDTLFVLPDGTAFTNTPWEEGTREVTVYKNGSVVAGPRDLHGWGRMGGFAITADSNFLYAAMRQGGCDGGNSDTNQYGQRQYPNCGTDWRAVVRYTHNGTPAPFSGGFGSEGNLLVVNSSADIMGLAVGGGKLFVNDRASNQIKVYNSSTLQLQSSWSHSSAGALAYAPSGHLWVLQSGGVIQKYSAAGGAQAQKVTVPGATAIAINPLNNTLLVADNGVDQNVKIYGGLDGTPTLQKTVGETGGVLAGPIKGKIGTTRFSGPTGVGVDASGNIYVSQNGTGPLNETAAFNATLSVVTSSGAPLHRLYSNEWVSAGVVDPATDGLHIYGRSTRYIMDYSKPAGSQATDYALTIDRFKYPNDPRIKMSSGFVYPIAVRTIQGKKFIYMTSMYATGVIVYRLDGEIAVPSGWLSAGRVGIASGNFPSNQPGGVWIWRDTNGDGDFGSGEYTSGDGSTSGAFGWHVDEQGHIWAVGQALRKYSVQGLDNWGNPIYSLNQSTTYPIPSTMGKVERLHYIAATDTLYLTGFAPGQSDDGCWGQVGKTMVRYNRFTSSPQKQFQVSIPSDCEGRRVPKAMDIAGDAIFIVDVSSGGHGTGILRVYSASTGTQTTSFYPGPTVANDVSDTGWIDIPYGLRAFQRANGQYVVLVEDDLYSKLLLYTWP